MSKIHLHASLQRFANNHELVEIPGNCTLNELLTRLVEEFPRLESIIFTPDKQLSPYLVVFVDQQDWRHLDENFIITANANVEIITSLVGG